MIVVLMGSGPDRILEAVDLYQEGCGDRIVMVENNQPGYDLLAKRGVTLLRDAHLAKSVGVQLGVPGEAFVILPQNALSTQDEARRVVKYLQANEEIDSMILVTSQYHSARAYKIFDWAADDLERDVKIVSKPSRYDEFDAKHWWRSREDAKRVVMEYLKLANFYVLDRWK
ncbi:MAG: YdcF family protein [Tissierellia bacterium]|nr:YdcF family protein [Tissierellia bacterium]